MSKELIAKLKETIKQQKSKIEDLKNDIIYYRQEFRDVADENYLIKDLYGIKENYYEILFDGKDPDFSARRIEEVAMIKGYSKEHAISMHLKRYVPSKDIRVSSIKCLSDD
jgi:hypothetical protein